MGGLTLEPRYEMQPSNHQASSARLVWSFIVMRKS